VVAAILEREAPPVSARQPLAPEAIDRIVATCLAKDPDERWPRARDVARELRWVRGGTGLAPTAVAVRRATPRAWTWLAVLAALTTAIVVWSPLARTTPPVRRITFSIPPPKGASFQHGSAEMAVSPDGTRLVFVALSADGIRRLWLRRFDVADAVVIPGTEGAAFPFWSPDGQLIGFSAHDELLTIDERGGSRTRLADARFGRGGSWNRDGTIVFSANNTISRVPAAGGDVTPVTALDAARKEKAHGFPVFLPDGRHVLYHARSIDPAQSAIYRVAIDGGPAQRVFASAANVVLAGPSLLSLNGRTLVAQPLDADGTQPIGEPIDVAHDVGVDVRFASGAFAAASDSALAYRAVGDQSRLTWHDRQGRLLSAFREPGDYQHPWLTSDDRYVIVEKTDPTSGRHTLWTLDLGRDVLSRLLDEPTGAHGPILSPDGTQVAFGSNRFGGVDIFVSQMDGRSEPQLLLKSTRESYRIGDWSPDGQRLIYWANGDLATLRLSSPGSPEPFLQTSAFELQPTFSPDMKWVAYTSDESGTPEVYVRRFPTGDNAWRVSTQGGAQPQWRRDGRELFYLAPDGTLMAADVDAAAGSFRTGVPKPLFDTGVRGLFLDRRNHYVVTRDGQRFMVNATADDDQRAPITVVLNWTADIAAAGRRGSR
jgi:Tol biopolymer transport system component